MKFGIHTYPFYQFPDLPSMVGYVQRAERLGYDYVDLPEHNAFPVEHESSMGQLWWDPIVLGAHLAHATKTIRLNFSVLILPQHNPLTVAKQIATLDHVSNGRVGVGVGVGWLEGEMALWGADYHKRGAITEEYIQVMKALWTTHPSAYQGKTVSISNVSCFPKPLQKPHPPIYVGGSPKTSCRRAAALGDGWMPMSASNMGFEEGMRVLKDALQSSGRSMQGFTIFKHLPLFDRNQEAREHSRKAGGGGDDPLHGDHARAIEEVRRYEQLGVTHMLVILPVGDFQRSIRELEAFAEKVMHRL